MTNKKVRLDVIQQCTEQDPAYYILDEKVITNLQESVGGNKEEGGSPEKFPKD